jgi:hypothetical protein
MVDSRRAVTDGLGGSVAGSLVHPSTEIPAAMAGIFFYSIRIEYQVQRIKLPTFFESYGG